MWSKDRRTALSICLRDNTQSWKIKGMEKLGMDFWDVVIQRKERMKCLLCHKANQCATKNTAHSWVHSQHCGYCHYLGMRTARQPTGRLKTEWLARTSVRLRNITLKKPCEILKTRYTKGVMDVKFVSHIRECSVHAVTWGYPLDRNQEGHRVVVTDGRGYLTVQSKNITE